MTFDGALQQKELISNPFFCFVNLKFIKSQTPSKEESIQPNRPALARATTSEFFERGTK